MERPRSVSHTHNDCENERVEKAVPSVMGRFLLIGSDRISAVFRSKGNQPLVFNNYGDGAIAFEHVFVLPLKIQKVRYSKVEWLVLSKTPSFSLWMGQVLKEGYMKCVYYRYSPMGYARGSLFRS
jgi:hypothetical protein